MNSSAIRDQAKGLLALDALSWIVCVGLAYGFYSGICGLPHLRGLAVLLATPGAYALVGMGAAFAGIVRAPMTSVLMIFEMTHVHAMIVPLMIANLVSLFITLKRSPFRQIQSLPL